MSVTDQHPEDIKAALRKRYGTVGAFAKAHDLKPQAVADWLRGRTSARVAGAIAHELGVRAEKNGESIKVDDSGIVQASHRLNTGSR